MINKYRSLAYKYAIKYYKTMKIPLEDVVQMGYINILMSIKSFNSESGSKEITWVTNNIHWYFSKLTRKYGEYGQRAEALWGTPIEDYIHALVSEDGVSEVTIDNNDLSEELDMVCREVLTDIEYRCMRMIYHEQIPIKTITQLLGKSAYRVHDIIKNKLKKYFVETCFAEF